MNRKTILLVEDNPQDEMLILRALKKINRVNQVDVARDGQQALDYLFCRGEFAVREDKRLPAVVLLDVGLPRLTGLEVLARDTERSAHALAAGGDTHVVRRGARSYEELQGRGEQLGAQAFIHRRVRGDGGAARCALVGNQ